MALTELRDPVASSRARLIEAQGYLALDHLRSEKDRLEAEMSDPELWTSDPSKARKLGGELAAVNDDLGALESLDEKVSDAETLLEMGLDAGEESLEPELKEMLSEIGKRLEALEIQSLFSGPYDTADAVCEIHSGAGGVDAQDWAEMMLRMYIRWAERRGFSVEIDEVTEGNEAGISSATFIVKGRYAYGLLAAERGIHRLVRISPFDQQARRQTSFAAFTLSPFMEEVADVTVEEKDLRVDTYRSTGAGGQHINTTDSAVRITHLPTGIVVTCQNQRSQIQNRERAMQVLLSKLADLAVQQRAAQVSAISGPQKDAAWGNQIRSYVLAPYQMVKDLRTNFETAKVDDVLDGDIEPLMESWLQWRRNPTTDD
jgi:peptide chain release factor 2